MMHYSLQIYFKLWTEYKMRIFVQNCWILGQVYLTSCMGTVIITTFYSERATGGVKMLYLVESLTLPCLPQRVHPRGLLQLHAPEAHLAGTTKGVVRPPQERVRSPPKAPRSLWINGDLSIHLFPPPPTRNGSESRSRERRSRSRDRRRERERPRRSRDRERSGRF